MKKLFFIMSNLLLFQAKLKKVDQYKRGRGLIHNGKHCKDNQLQSLELPCRIL